MLNLLLYVISSSKQYIQEETIRNRQEERKVLNENEDSLKGLLTKILNVYLWLILYSF